MSAAGRWMAGFTLVTGLLCIMGTASAAPLRLAIVVGSNEGSNTQPVLRYAESDAARMASALHRVCGFETDSIRILRGPGREQLEGAFAAAKAQIEQHDGRALLVFYFSGHADGKHLELGNERVAWVTLKGLLSESGASVRIALLDACRSGGYIETKGVTQGPSFQIDLQWPLDSSGTAVLTSSSAAEAAQESSEVGGSYFTHHFVSALYGAADEDGDLRVTLDEAYRYTYRRTVGNTIENLPGAQHPTYSLDLSGTGDLVLSTHPEGGAVVVIPEDHRGEYFLVEMPEREVMAELAHDGARERHLFIPPGRYQLVRRQADLLAAGDLTLAAGDLVRVDPEQLTDRPVRFVTSRGDEQPGNVLYGGYTLGGWFLPEMGAAHGVHVAYQRALGPVALRARFSWARTAVSDNGFRYDLDSFEGSLVGLLPFHFHRFDLMAGIVGGASWMTQRSRRYDDKAAWAGVAGLHLGVDLHLARGLALLMGFEFDLFILSVDDRLSARPAPRADIGLGWRF